MCRCGRCEISCGTDATKSMDITVLCVRGFTAPIPLNNDLMGRRSDMVLGIFYHKINIYSFDN